MYKTNKERKRYIIESQLDIKRINSLSKLLIIVILLFTVVVIIVNYYIYVSQKEIRSVLFGNWDTLFVDIDDEYYFKNNAFIDDYAIQRIYNKSFKVNDYSIVVGSSEDNFLNLGGIKLLSGKMPYKSNEVAIEEDYLNVLGVQRVGDVISDDSPLKILRGFKVCGVLSNYTNRWKTINWDVKYINCFIKRNDSLPTLESQCYVRFKNPLLKKSICINFLNYKENAKISFFLIDKISLYLWIAIIFLLFLSILIKKMKIKEFYNKTMSFDDINFMVRREKIKKLFMIFLLTSFIFLVITLFDKIMFENTSFYSYIVMEESRGKYEKFNIIFDDHGYIKYLEKDKIKIGILEEIRYYPCKTIVNIIDLIIIIFIIFVQNILIYYNNLYFIDNKINNERNFLLRYFYGEYYFKESLLRKNLLKEIIFGCSIYTMLFFNKKRLRRKYYV